LLTRVQSGELLLKGPNVFQGYWSRPELNKETFTEDGWFKTGDVMYIDTSGNLFITDRIKELIKYSMCPRNETRVSFLADDLTEGFQVAPAELEAKLIGRKDIADVCVIGVWNEEEQTEAPRAYVVPSAGVDGSEELAADIIEWLGSRVGPSKRLRGGVRFVKEIPKSPSGKILRRILRDQMNKEEGRPKAKL
jgi:acyl-CoA synthetase (AMP-forming)/AMP-acid ligase II